jgi:mRNA-degrading endonuclease RelE of RelBE toxin-antitoxin system
VPHQLLIKDSARREIDAIPLRFRVQVEDRIQLLSENPRPLGSVSLKGKAFRGLRRTRSGDYRIIYQVNDDTVVIVKVGNRRDVYD